jgi:hypothetical protein
MGERHTKSLKNHPNIGMYMWTKCPVPTAHNNVESLHETFVKFILTIKVVVIEGELKLLVGSISERRRHHSHAFAAQDIRRGHEAGQLVIFKCWQGLMDKSCLAGESLGRGHMTSNNRLVSKSPNVKLKTLFQKYLRSVPVKFRVY